MTVEVSTVIVGCGDTGVRIAARAVAAGETVLGIVRGEDSAARLRSVGGRSRRIDLDGPVGDLPACRRLVYSAPPARAQATDARMARVLEAMPGVPAHVVYISTSGVYGDCGGDWVDEARPVAPDTDRAKRRVDAERRIMGWARHAVVLRAPGIYGPGRLTLDRVRAGEPVLADRAGGWTNRVHVDDLAGIAWHMATEPPPHAIYNACDGVPTRREAYYDTLAELLGVAAPPRIDWAEARQRFSAMRLSFLAESRRLSNARLLADTRYRLVFPDYRDGILASLRGDPVLAPGY
ncbi:SDR family oxidoreductase [Salinisphaera sp.]|uniref:SDR family oxidoreductase n=1 Tax=Salinisphaera sp. TaxID=1914330 RepID=UPI002D79FC6C|nr:SDR family oxidoreductase [Salinisphaera sp.]HET7315407.1 SDR family oxidoreductase [Salinisphaera sp.]